MSDTALILLAGLVYGAAILKGLCIIADKIDAMNARLDRRPS